MPAELSFNGFLLPQRVETLYNAELCSDWCFPGARKAIMAFKDPPLVTTRYPVMQNSAK